MTRSNSIASLFTNLFHRTPVLFVAPGRINLIGEHTDYNEGFVMPAAIDKNFMFAVAPNGTDVVNGYAADLDESLSFSMSNVVPGHHWSNYLMGVVDGFARRGVTPGGVDVAFTSTVPTGAGLSSSAALCSGFGFALNDLFGFGLDRLELVRIAQETEHRFIGVKVGIMDMYASLFSRVDAAMLLDCRTYTHRYLPVHFEGHSWLLVDTRVKHALASSGYNDRRASCEAGVAALQKKIPDLRALRDVTLAQLESLRPLVDELVWRRCAYVVNEIARAQQAADLLAAGDVDAFGKLMYATHWGLSVDYGVSCTESDWLVRAGADLHVRGARQMGGGFGGCVLFLIQNDLLKPFETAIREKYFTAFQNEPEFYSVKLADGVHRMS